MPSSYHMALVPTIAIASSHVDSVLLRHPLVLWCCEEALRKHRALESQVCRRHCACIVMLTLGSAETRGSCVLRHRPTLIVFPPRPFSTATLPIYSRANCFSEEQQSRERDMTATCLCYCHFSSPHCRLLTYSSYSRECPDVTTGALSTTVFPSGSLPSSARHPLSRWC